MLYWEKRTIHDINDNIYDIWVIYTIGKFGILKQVCVFDEEEHFKDFEDKNIIEYKPMK